MRTASRWLLPLLRYLLAALLIVAALSKLHYPLIFARDVQNFQVVGPLLSRWIALWLPVLEVLLALLLIRGRWIETGLAMVAGLMLIFFLAVLQAFARGIDLNCGCFGGLAEQRIGWGKLLENLFLLIVSFFTWRWQIRCTKKPL